MEVINKIKIDLLKPGVKPMINAMQADENSRVLEITLSANGSAWGIPDGVSFSMAYKKPDGTRGLYDTMPDGTSASSVDGNVVSIRLAPQVLTAPGTVTASVVISAGDQRISTFPIIVNVIQNPAVGAVGSEDYFYSSEIGNLDDLKTTDKTSLVAAINEIFSTGGGSNSGQNVTLSTARINALDGMFKVCAYDDSKPVAAAYLAFKTAFGITDSGEEEPDIPVEPDEPVIPEVTLTSISATYNGGDVPVGTDVADLTGIVVTAHYSDGSSKSVTGYTLSGTVAEGSNTVTVRYGGKTTAFTVTGVAESGGETSDILYELSEPMTFNGTNGITTDAVVTNVDDFSVVLDYEFEATTTTMCVIEGWRATASGGRGISVETKMNTGYYRLFVEIDGYKHIIAPAGGGTYFATAGKQTVRIVATKCIGNTTTKACCIINGVRVVDSITNEMPFGGANTKTVNIAPTLIGTINELKIFNRVLSDEEIEAYLA